VNGVQTSSETEKERQQYNDVKLQAASNIYSAIDAIITNLVFKTETVGKLPNKILACIILEQFEIPFTLASTSEIKLIKLKTVVNTYSLEANYSNKLLYYNKIILSFQYGIFDIFCLSVA